jgi:hypothetical protein
MRILGKINTEETLENVSGDSQTLEKLAIPVKRV